MNKLKICLSIASMDSAFEAMVDKLSKIAQVRVVPLDGYEIDDADIFIGKKMTHQMLNSATNLKAIFAYKTGVEDFPLKDIEKRGIALFNSHANSDYIAQYAFSLATTLVSRIAEFDRKLRVGNWALDNPHWDSIFQMKVGLVGYGSIGKAIHAILANNNIDAYTLDRGKEYQNIKTVATLEELCAECNLLFLSLPNVKSTDNMFDENIFSHLKGKFIVNVGRGNCIDENAMYNSLVKGELGGVAIDTWRRKTHTVGRKFIPYETPLNTLDNVVMTSHKAMQLDDGHQKYVEDVAINVIAYINGDKTRNQVDLKKGY